MKQIFDLKRRPRRLRQSDNIRRMFRETTLSVDDLILPIFIEEGIDKPVVIESLPGVMRYPESMIAEVVLEAEALGIPGVMLFGVSQNKDDEGSDSWDEKGLQSRMIRTAKQAAPNMVIIADSCFCEYTSHGHCGVVDHDCADVDNDLTLLNLQKQAVCSAQAGADIIAPSGMMDGMVLAIRSALDEAGFLNIPIMSYSTKFASSFYGPFREAVASEFKGTRNAYQLDCANSREALLESLLDEAEGADILMVKPGLPYLDVMAKIKEQTLSPMAVYHVSGEYAMIKFAAQAQAIDEEKVVMETMVAFKRAGADMILTYFAKDIAKWLSGK